MKVSHVNVWVEWTEKKDLSWVELNVGLGLGAQTGLGECAFKTSKHDGTKSRTAQKHIRGLKQKFKHKWFAYVYTHSKVKNYTFQVPTPWGERKHSGLSGKRWFRFVLNFYINTQ